MNEEIVPSGDQTQAAHEGADLMRAGVDEFNAGFLQLGAALDRQRILMPEDRAYGAWLRHHDYFGFSRQWLHTVRNAYLETTQGGVKSLDTGEVFKIEALAREWTKRNKPEPEPAPALPAGDYDLILADPPWRYDFAETSNRQIENQYPTMAVDDIANLEIPAADDAVLYLWATTAKLVEALTVMDAWGFTYKSSMVWVKDKIGMGYHARGRHEFILIGTKGTPGTPEPENRPDSVIEAPRGKHSAKPDRLYELIEMAWPETTKLELFARNEREGWESWGNEA